MSGKKSKREKQMKIAVYLMIAAMLLTTFSTGLALLF